MFLLLLNRGSTNNALAHDIFHNQKNRKFDKKKDSSKNLHSMAIQHPKKLIAGFSSVSNV